MYSTELRGDESTENLNELCEQVFGLTLNIYINANPIGRPPSAAYILMGPDT